MTHVTEVHAYNYILNELTKKKGWKKGQIYTQNEYQNNKLIKEQLNRDTPENIVEISPTQFYVIESKSTRLMLKRAVEEAQIYAESINRSDQIKAVFVTGVAGNDVEGYICSSQFLHNDVWETIIENESEITGLLSTSEVQKILQTNNPILKDVEITEEEFLKTAEEINDILHENAIHKDARAKFISAILLALSKKTDIDLGLDPIELVNAINTKVDSVLKKEGKPDFSRFIHIDMPSSEDNHVKLKKAIVRSVQSLYGLNIQSAMRSGKDVLGKFYEVFLKYGNGAKEIGIVLTPRHITHFAAEVVDVQANDLLLDPTCGTGGFLVAAFDEVKKKADDEAFQEFRKYGLYGIEEQDSIVALALVNMIFRGDGKNNIIEGNCFAKWLYVTTKEDPETKKIVACADYRAEDASGRDPPITKVLMNPPFPKKKADIKEFRFIEQALDQMQDGGILFSVLPYSCMIKGGKYLSWRTNLVKKNTVLSVVTFPEDLFYPVGVHTLGVFIQKGIPHKKSQNVVWMRALNDGRWKKKGKRLPHPRAQDDFPKITPQLKSFMKNQNTPIPSIPAFQKVSPIDLDDGDLELVPEAYLDEPPITHNEIESNIDTIIRENIAFLIKYEDKLGGLK